MPSLTAITTDPEADEPRLAYARTLRLRGDPRGEFIELQCALARPGDPPPSDLARREAELLRVHGEAWLAEVGLDHSLLRDPTVNGSWWRRFTTDPAGGPPYFVRGFLDRLVLDDDDLARPSFVAALPDLVARSVRWNAGLDRWRLGLERLAGLSRLEDLDIRAPLGEAVPEVCFAELCASPVLRRLRSLEVESPCGGWAGQLVEAGPLALRGLGIGFAPLDPESAQTLAGSVLGRLETLVGYGSMPAETVEVLARSGGRLRRLVQGRLTVEGFARLLGALPTLADVARHSASLTVEESAALAERPELGGLSSLTVTGSGLGGLAASPHLERLRSLTLVCATLTDLDLEALARARLPRLESFALYGLRSGEVGPAGLAAFATAPWLEGLRSLSAVRVGPGIAAALAGSPWLRGLVELRLAENDLDDASAASLAGSPIADRLVHLDLNTNDLGADGFAALARSERLGRIRCLNVWFNPGPDDALARAGYFATTVGHWCR